MGISLKPAHLRRYRNIARLLVKYGRGDLMRAAGLDGDLEQFSEVSSVSGEMSGPRVHEKPGEILELGARRAQEEKNGKPKAKAKELLVGVEPGERAPQKLAAQLADDLEKMGPTYVKVGQFLSTRPDLLPVIYCEALARLQDEVEPFPFQNVEQIVRRISASGSPRRSANSRRSRSQRPPWGRCTARSCAAGVRWR
jgi:hypothetical protein